MLGEQVLHDKSTRTPQSPYAFESLPLTTEHQGSSSTPASCGADHANQIRVCVPPLVIPHP